MHCKWSYKSDADWPRLLLASNHQSSVAPKVLTFLRDFHFLDNHGNPKHSPKKVRDKRRTPNRAVVNHTDQLATHILETTTTGKDLRVTRLTCNNGVNFRNRSNCWSQWPFHSSRLCSRCLIVWIWISWKFIHHRMSVSNRWFLSLKNSLPSQHSRQSNKYKTEQPILSGV